MYDELLYLTEGDYALAFLEKTGKFPRWVPLYRGGIKTWRRFHEGEAKTLVREHQLAAKAEAFRSLSPI